MVIIFVTLIIRPKLKISSQTLEKNTLRTLEILTIFCIICNIHYSFFTTNTTVERPYMHSNPINQIVQAIYYTLGITKVAGDMRAIR
jgi:hypothetical protein